MKGSGMKELIRPGFFGTQASADTRRREFDILNEQYLYSGKTADIIFFGDSITHYWDLNLYFNPNILKINRGIGGDCTVYAAKRFDADVLQLNAEIIVILIGINDLISTAPDLWWKDPGQDVDTVMKNIEEGYRDMLSICYGKKVYVCSLLPQRIAPPFDRDELKELILTTNDMLEKLSDEYKSEYVDYYSVLEQDGLLPEDLSCDGIHPNGKCYKIMASVLKEKIDIL